MSAWFACEEAVESDDSFAILSVRPVWDDDLVSVVSAGERIRGKEEEGSVNVLPAAPCSTGWSGMVFRLM